jgi:hypothetical protein
MLAILIGLFIYARLIGTEELTGRRSDGDLVGAVAPAAARPIASQRAVDRWLLPIYVVGVDGLPDPAGRRDDPVQLQRPDRPLEPRLARVLARRMADPLGARPGEAVRNSLVVAFSSTIIATALGTLIALALTRYQFRGAAHEPADLPADGDAGDRARRVAADDCSSRRSSCRSRRACSSRSASGRS